MANIHLAGLLGGGWRNLPFESFRAGIKVHWIERGGQGEPIVAILHYSPGATVPLHRHEGLETIIVLEGSQSDENGEYRAGDVVFNAKGSQHSVWSKDGCVVFVNWDQPVTILGADE